MVLRLAWGRHALLSGKRCITTGSLLPCIQLRTSLDPEGLRLTLKANSDPGFVINDPDLPQGTYFQNLTSTLYLLPNSESEL